MNASEARQRIVTSTTQTIPMDVIIRLSTVEQVAHDVRVRELRTFDAAREINAAGNWIIEYSTGSRVFRSKPGDVRLGDGALRQAYELAQQWMKRNE